MTIRERVKQIQIDLRDHAVTPQMARTHVVALTALYGNVMDEQAAADIAYKRVLLGHYETEKTANRARLRAETSAEYARFTEARNLEKLVLEMIRSCKTWIKSQDEELRMSGRT